MMIKIKVTFLTVCWQEKNEDVCYHWQSPGQRDIIREMFHFLKKREGRRKRGREGGRTIFSLYMNIFKINTESLTNPFLIFLPLLSLFTLVFCYQTMNQSKW